MLIVCLVYTNNPFHSLHVIFTLYAHVQAGGYVIDGVHIYIYTYVFYIYCIYLWTKKKIESYFSNRLTFSNIRSRTRIYRLALPLHAPETLSSLSKSRISIVNAHLALLSEG